MYKGVTGWKRGWSRGKSNALSQGDPVTWPIFIPLSPLFLSRQPKIHALARHHPSRLILPLRTHRCRRRQRRPPEISVLFFHLSLLLFLSLSSATLLRSLSSRRTQLGKTIIICARVPSTPSSRAKSNHSRNPCFSSLFFFFYPSPRFPRLKALSLAKSWTHYVVIYEQDNGAWQPSARKENPLVSAIAPKPLAEHERSITGAEVESPFI